MREKEGIKLSAGNMICANKIHSIALARALQNQRAVTCIISFGYMAANVATGIHLVKLTSFAVCPNLAENWIRVKEGCVSKINKLVGFRVLVKII